jgi:hypothetical protein
MVGASLMQIHRQQAQYRGEAYGLWSQTDLSRYQNLQYKRQIAYSLEVITVFLIKWGQLLCSLWGVNQMVKVRYLAQWVGHRNTPQIINIISD